MSAIIGVKWACYNPRVGSFRLRVSGCHWKSIEAVRWRQVCLSLRLRPLEASPTSEETAAVTAAAFNISEASHQYSLASQDLLQIRSTSRAHS